MWPLKAWLELVPLSNPEGKSYLEFRLHTGRAAQAATRELRSRLLIYQHKWCPILLKCLWARTTISHCFPYLQGACECLCGSVAVIPILRFKVKSGGIVCSGGGTHRAKGRRKMQFRSRQLWLKVDRWKPKENRRSAHAEGCNKNTAQYELDFLW